MATMNTYTELINDNFYRDTPKAVFAALAISYLINHQGADYSKPEILEQMLVNEWHLLHQAGVIPQEAAAGSWRPRFDLPDTDSDEG